MPWCSVCRDHVRTKEFPADSSRVRTKPKPKGLRPCVVKGVGKCYAPTLRCNTGTSIRPRKGGAEIEGGIACVRSSSARPSPADHLKVSARRKVGHRALSPTLQCPLHACACVISHAY